MRTSDPQKVVGLMMLSLLIRWDGGVRVLGLSPQGGLEPNPPYGGFGHYGFGQLISVIRLIQFVEDPPIGRGYALEPEVLIHKLLQADRGRWFRHAAEIGFGSGVGENERLFFHDNIVILLMSRAIRVSVVQVMRDKVHR